MHGACIKFPVVLVQELKIGVDYRKFSMLLIFIL